MRILYYCEVNAICVVILLLFADQMRYKSDRRSSANRLFSLLLWTTVILCLSDMVAGICRGQSFHGAHLLTELSNMLFFEAISAGSFLWMLYVFARLHLLEKSRRGFFWWSLPFVLITAVILTNPLTHFVFTIDADNLYTRSTGIYIHWAVSWFYLLCPTLLTIQRMLRSRTKTNAGNSVRFSTISLHRRLLPLFRWCSTALLFLRSASPFRLLHILLPSKTIKCL